MGAVVPVGVQCQREEPNFRNKDVVSAHCAAVVDVPAHACEGFGGHHAAGWRDRVEDVEGQLGVNHGSPTGCASGER